MKSHAKTVASVSLDADNLWSYKRTHGDADWVERPSYLMALAGRMLVQERGNGNTFELAGKISNPGVYFLRVTDNAGKEYAGKLLLLSE